MFKKKDKPAKVKREQTRGEEVMNALTHGIGAALSIAALAVLVAFASVQGDPWAVVGVSIYGATLIILYLASTLYHAITHPKVKKVFKLIDHSSINLLIAGTYTPVTLVTLRGAWGWTLFGIIWGLAILGICRDIFFPKLKGLAVTLYLLMGWLVVIAVGPMMELSQSGLLIFLALGGLCYTVGVVFYIWRGFKFHHGIWHIFVLAGSILQFFGILLFLYPKGA
jgi:hemolysin III